MQWSFAMVGACVVFVALLTAYVPTIYIRKTNKVIALLEQRNKLRLTLRNSCWLRFSGCRVSRLVIKGPRCRAPFHAGQREARSYCASTDKKNRLILTTRDFRAKVRDCGTSSDDQLLRNPHPVQRRFVPCFVVEDCLHYAATLALRFRDSAPTPVEPSVGQRQTIENSHFASGILGVTNLSAFGTRFSTRCLDAAASPE
jgi:hypothetical protein